MPAQRKYANRLRQRAPRMAIDARKDLLPGPARSGGLDSRSWWPCLMFGPRTEAKARERQPAPMSVSTALTLDSREALPASA